jgi:hypothetical protein
LRKLAYNFMEASMPHFSKWIVPALLFILVGLPPNLSAQATQERALTLRRVVVNHGVELHYVERGTGAPLVFVHGSLSDGMGQNAR